MSVVLLQDRFDYPDGIITNEYATHHPGEVGIHESPLWQVTSGSLFARLRQGYTGLPDGGEGGVDIDSARQNGSAVLRVVTKRKDFSNYSVQFGIVLLQLTHTPRTPVQDHDGVHVFVNRQDENNTYYADVFRRDSLLYIKRKLRGQYVALSRPTNFAPTFGVAYRIEVVTRTLSDAVQIDIYIDGILSQSAVDNSADAIVTSGATGFRGDNCEFLIDEFEVRSLDP